LADLAAILSKLGSATRRDFSRAVEAQKRVGLQCLRENSAIVPQGRLKVAQDVVLGRNWKVPRGTAEYRRRVFSRPFGTTQWRIPTQDYVLGYFQASLRD
jgi:hypothetical protein